MSCHDYATCTLEHHFTHTHARTRRIFRNLLITRRHPSGLCSTSSPSSAASRSPRARLPRSPHVSRLVLPPPRSPWALTLGSLLLSLSPRGLRARTRDPRPASSLTHYGTSGGKSSRAFHVLRGCVQSRAWRPRTCSRSLWWTAPSSVAAHCPPSAWHAPSAPERR